MPFVKTRRRPGRRSSAVARAGFRRDDGHVDVVDEIEELLRLDTVDGHQAREGGAVVAVVLLLQAVSLLAVDIQQLADEGPHLDVDLREQVAGRRIKRVVQVEHPDVDLREIRRICWGEGHERAEDALSDA